MLRTFSRAILAALAAALVLLLAAIFSPAVAAELTEADLTRGTACGAPGVGKAYAGSYKDRIEARDGAPGQHVNDAGMWAECTMPTVMACPRLAPVTHWEGGRPVTYSGVRAAPLGRFHTQHVRTHRNPRDGTVIKSTTRRLYCTSAGWSTSKPE